LQNGVEMNIGFVGLGVMGKPMARNLMKAGHTVYGYDVVRESVEELARDGAIPCSDLKTVAENCPVIFSMLPNGPHVKSVLFDEGGLTHYAKPGTLFIDISSISPNDDVEIGGKLKALGMRLVDAPVSGAYAGAVAGNLAVMAGGSDEDFAEALEYLSIIGGEVTHMGPLGSGNTCKLCNQIMIVASLAAVSESMMLAKKMGCDMEKVYKAIRTGFAGSKVMDSQVPKILEHEFKAGFKIDYHMKDLKNVAAAAEKCGAPIPMTEFGMRIFSELQEDGYGYLDNSGVAKYYEKLAGCSYLD